MNSQPLDPSEKKISYVHSKAKEITTLIKKKDRLLRRLSNLACAGKKGEGIGGTMPRSWFWLVFFPLFLFLCLGFKMEFEFDSNPSKLADKHRK